MRRRRAPMEIQEEFARCRAALDRAHEGGEHLEVIRVLTRMVLLQQELLRSARDGTALGQAALGSS